MNEKRETISFHYAPFNNKETTKGDIKILAEYLSKMTKDNRLTPGNWSFSVEKNK